MNKYTILYLFALIALAYAQNTAKSIPTEIANGSSDSQETPVVSAPKTKLPPNEYLASKGITTTIQAQPTKALPTKLVQANGGAQATTVHPASPATPTPVKAGNNTVANTTSDAVKVTGTLLAAIVASVMALY
ncbi:hypothetical protein H8356DRAFT_1624845 [Neocallimastix lanati (nom. inval.)]|uniref:Uncharacterized protein n=1 Tax=Neocallimastix californiae TaxID=1754190 RepID=A0A1Y2F1H2_9FUNG|nr:hypothetical protein H8356DRAFT_1624845 [Neocallimastix sp. JGI-2020a]ORY76815.1 hypothetical protein LY90DRAFT_665536 [Neocallimastix californiae]|eukprot:ORY76815.1 hypothetical protein LY90DRAFT_665536 [Neocallimastix californiae]